jgi:hypothetical protein
LFDKKTKLVVCWKRTFFFYWMELYEEGFRVSMEYLQKRYKSDYAQEEVQIPSG